MLCDAAFWEPAALPGSHVASYGDADSIDAMAERVLADAPERFLLAGHSMGGRVAQEIVRRAPQRVAKLALIGTDYRGPSGDEAPGRAALLEEARALGWDGFARRWAVENVAPHRAGDQMLISRIARMVARQSFATLAAQSLAGLGRRDYAELLPRIACPVLVVAGDSDRLRPVETHRDMARHVPDGRLAVLGGCGHMAALEQPQALAAVMGAWAGPGFF